LRTTVISDGVGSTTTKFIESAHAAILRDVEGRAYFGEFETSVMLTVRPELVHMDEAQPGDVGDQFSIAPVVFEKGFRAVTENGVLGEPCDVPRPLMVRPTWPR